MPDRNQRCGQRRPTCFSPTYRSSSFSPCNFFENSFLILIEKGVTLSFRKHIQILFWCTLILFLACGNKAEKNSSAPPFDFSLPDLSGKVHTLKEFSGKMVLLNFWATWCPACKEDIATLEILNREYKNSGLEIIGISLDKKGLGEVDSFVQEMKIPYTILLGDETVVKSYGGLKGVPTSFLLDKEGRIVKRYSGQISHEAISSDLKVYLGK